MWSRIVRIVGILVFLVVLVIGIEFAAVNSTPVTVNYFLGTLSLPLSLVVVCAFTVGVLLTLLVGATVVLPLRLRAAGLRRDVAARDYEIERLRKHDAPRA